MIAAREASGGGRLVPRTGDGRILRRASLFTLTGFGFARRVPVHRWAPPAQRNAGAVRPKESLPSLARGLHRDHGSYPSGLTLNRRASPPAAVWNVRGRQAEQRLALGPSSRFGSRCQPEPAATTAAQGCAAPVQPRRHRQSLFCLRCGSWPQRAAGRRPDGQFPADGVRPRKRRRPTDVGGSLGTFARPRLRPAGAAVRRWAGSIRFIG